MREKDQSIETLRGIAILLLLWYHATITNALTTTGDDVHRYAIFSVQYIRMPLFTCISGFVYAIRPPSSDTALFPFITGKARRLLIPCFVLLTIRLVLGMAGVVATTPVDAGSWHNQLTRGYVVDTSVTGVTEWDGTLAGIFANYFDKPATLWFVQAMFVVFMLTAGMERFKFLATPSRWVACVCCAAAITVLIPAGERPRFFSLGSVVYLLPYFLLGVGLQRYGERIFRPTVLAITGAVAATGITLQWLGGFELIEISLGRTDSLLAVVVGGSSLILIFRWRPTSRFLAWIGDFSYPIYLFHRFMFIIALLAMASLWTPAIRVLWFVAVSLTLSIALALIARRYNGLRILLLGLRPRPRRSGPDAPEPKQG